MKIITTDQAPAPAGHYSQAIVHDGVVFVAGQIPIDSSGRALADASIEIQTETVLRNIQAILRAAGSDLNRVLQMTVYVTDMADWSRVNEVYAKIMGGHRPARAVVPVGDLHNGVGVEVQTVAAVGAE